jgi:hypothetical protein
MFVGTQKTGLVVAQRLVRGLKGLICTIEKTDTTEKYKKLMQHSRAPFRTAGPRLFIPASASDKPHSSVKTQKHLF